MQDFITASKLKRLVTEFVAVIRNISIKATINMSILWVSERKSEKLRFSKTDRKIHSRQI